VRFNGDKVNFTSKDAFSATNYTVGEKNPRWKMQVSRGQAAGTDFTGELNHIHTTPFIISQEAIPRPGWTPNPYSYQSSTNFGTRFPSFPSLHPGSLSETKANNKALEILVRKIRSKQTSWQGGVFFGELMQTVGLIANRGKLIRQHLDDYARNLERISIQLKRTSTERKLVAVANTWLEYQLGWAPLVAEIDDAAKTVAESDLLLEGSWEPTRAVGNDKILISSQTSQVGSGYPRFEVTNTIHSDVTVRYISCIDVGTYNVISARRLGLSPDNWLPTLWELIPYSFVVDYFTNIGDMISAASLARSSIRWTLKTVRKQYISEFINWKPIPTPNTYYYTYALTQVTPGKVSRVKRVVTRSPYNGSFVPDIVFNTNVSGTQWLNIAGLAVMRKELRNYFR
jgi:hypothetical protein